MRKYVVTICLVSIMILLAGCGKKEVLMVGTPFQDEEGQEAVNFEKEITDAKRIEAVRELVRKSEEIEESDGFTTEEVLFFSLDRPKEGVSEIRRYLYIEKDGSSVLKAKGQEGSDGFPDHHYALNEEQTTALLKLLK